MKKLRPCSGRCRGRADNTQHLNLGHVGLWLLFTCCDPENLDPRGLRFPQLCVIGMLVCSLNGGGGTDKSASRFQVPIPSLWQQPQTCITHQWVSRVSTLVMLPELAGQKDKMQEADCEVDYTAHLERDPWRRLWNERAGIRERVCSRQA